MSIMWLISLDIDLLQIMFDLLLYLVLIFQNVLEFVVIINRMFWLEQFQEFILLLDDVLNMVWLKVSVYLSLG